MPRAMFKKGFKTKQVPATQKKSRKLGHSAQGPKPLHKWPAQSATLNLFKSNLGLR